MKGGLADEDDHLRAVFARFAFAGTFATLVASDSVILGVGASSTIFCGAGVGVDLGLTVR